MDSPIAVVLTFLVAALVVGATWYVTHKRRQAFKAFARSHGLEYAHRDPWGISNLPFRLFRKGDGRSVPNMLWGQWRGEPIKAFDFEYYEERTAPNGDTARTTYRYTCVALEVEAAFPHLEIGREHALTRLADGLGFRDIEFESEEFNRRFQIASVDRRFAYELIDARMMQWLLSLPEKATFEVLDRWLLMAIKKRVEPVGFAPLIEMTLGFRRQIPRVAWSLYGRDREIVGKELG